MSSLDQALLVDAKPNEAFPPAGVGVVVFDVVGTLVTPARAACSPPSPEGASHAE